MAAEKPRLTASDFAPEVLSLFDKYVHGGIDQGRHGVEQLVAERLGDLVAVTC